MILISEDLKYLKSYAIDRFEDGFGEWKVCLEKSYFPQKELDQYFVKIYKRGLKNFECLGYVYFYLDLKTKKSTYIGLYVKDEWRNKGLASLLMAYYITLMLDNNYLDIRTNFKQRKPFLLYLLKKFSFELNDIGLYQTSINVVSLYRNFKDNYKYLLFKNPVERDSFKKGTIMQGDNYVVLSQKEEGLEFLDNVILSMQYLLQDENEAYQRALSKINNFTVKKSK